jgi:hypothetical protein
MYVLAIGYIHAEPGRRGEIEVQRPSDSDSENVPKSGRRHRYGGTVAIQRREAESVGYEDGATDG